MNKKHEILIGPYRSGKSWLLIERALQHCLNAAKDNRQETGLAGETIIIVPSQRYRNLVERRLKILISKSAHRQPPNQATQEIQEIKGLWGLKILTLFQFCQTYLLQAGVFVRTLPDAAKGTFLSAICQQLMQAKKISKLKPILKASGTQSSILSLIEEWQRAGYTAADITKILENKDQTNIKEHQKELIEIFNAYQKALSKLDYTDQHGLVIQLTDFLNKHQQINWLPKFIVVDGFDRLNAMQIDLLKALTKHVEQLYLSFDYKKSGEELFEEYAWKERSYEQIRAQLNNSFAFTETTQSLNHQTRAIEVVPAGDRFAEIAIIAARIKWAISFDKLKANEIVVTARNLAPYKSAIEAAFKDAGVDYHIDEPVNINSIPLIRLLISLLALGQNDFKRKQVIDCLRSPYFALHKFALESKDVELLNTLSLNKKVVSGRQQWQQALTNESRLAKKFNTILDVLSMPNTISSAIDYVSWAEDLIDKVLDFNAIDAGLDPLSVWKQKEALAQFRRQLGSLIREEDILQKLKEDFGDLSYYDRLTKLTQKANFAPPPANANQILIANAELVPNRLYKQIYLAGLLEGEFPATKTNNGFLTTHELDQWRRLEIYLYDPRMEPGFEYALFASLVNRATEKLTLSYPTIEITSGKDELLPSFFFNALNIQPENNGSIFFAQAEKSFTSPRNALAYSFWQGLSPAELSANNKLEAVKNFIDHIQKKLSFAQIRSKRLWQSPLNGYLVDGLTAANAKIVLPEYWNAGQLSDYGKCPFNFWLTRLLKITPHDEPETGLSIQDRGTFYHKALELFYQNIIENKITIVLEQEKKLQDIFNNAIKDALDWLENESWFRPNEFWVQEKTALVFHLNNFFAAEFKRFIGETEHYQPMMVEAVFGPDRQYQSLTLTKNGKTIKIRGKIDRIDMAVNSFGHNKKLRLVDYKSGSTFISRDDFESGRNIQLPIYALAAEKFILPGSVVSSYQYLSIRTGKILSSTKQDEMGVQEDLNLLQETIFAFVENIEKGDFSVKPSSDKICPTCIHKKVCRVKEFPGNER